MQFNPKIHHRRSIRLQGYDYTQAGAYFVTIVTYQRECLFGAVVNDVMRLNDWGKIVQWEWLDLPKRFPYLTLGAYQIMPNHLHGILFFHKTVGATRQELADASVINVPLPAVNSDDHKTVGATRQELADASVINVPLPAVNSDDHEGSPLRPNGPKPASLGAIIGQFKSRVTKRLWKIPSLRGTPVWQRNYYERIIRDEQEMDRIWRYIEANPSRWDEDAENPVNAVTG